MAEINQYALTTLEDVREALFMEASETKDDNFLINLINRISARIETYLGFKVLRREFTEYQDGDGSRNIFIDNPPIISVSGIWDDIDRQFTTDYEIVVTDYMVYDKEGIITLYNDESYFQKGMQNVKITYSGGYTTIPEDIEDACIEWVLTQYRKHKDKIFGYTSKSAPGGSIGIDVSKIPEEIKGILDMYRLVRIG